MSTELVVSQMRGLAIQGWDDLIKRSEYLSQSQLVPLSLRGKPHDIAIVLQMGMEVGFSSMQALNSIEPIQGKPTIKPEAQLGLIYQNCPGAVIEIEVDTVKLIARVSMARSKDSKPFVSVWDMDRAKKMGLATKDNYIKQPATMLRHRAVGEAARTVFPDVMRGLKNSFEFEETIDEGTGQPITKADELAALLKPEPIAVVAEVVEPKSPPTTAKEATGDFASFSETRVTPEVVVTPAPQADPGDYVMPPFSRLAGSRLRNVGFAQVQADLAWWEDIERSGGGVNGQGREFMNAARKFLATKPVVQTEGNSNATSNA